MSTSRRPLYLTQFLSGIVWVTLGPLLDSILRELDISLSQGGVPALAFFCGNVLGIAATNLWLARVPVKWCLVGGAVLEAAALAASALFARSLLSFCAPYFFAGMATVVLGFLPGMWITAHVKEGTARAMTIMMMASVAGMTVSPVVLGVLLNAGVSWRRVYIGEAVLALLIAGVLALLPLADVPGRQSVRGRHLREVARFNPRLLFAILASSFMYLGAEMLLITWLPKFELDVFKAGEALAGFSVTFYFIGQIAGRMAAVPLTRRFMPSSLLWFNAVTMALFAGLIAISPGRTLSLVLTFAAGLCSSAAFSYIAAYASKFPGWYSATVFSGFQLFGGIGSMVFPYLTGPVASSLGFRAAIAIAVVPALIVAFLALRLRAASGEQKEPVAVGASRW